MMGVRPVLTIKSDEGIITVRARLRDNISKHDIVLNSVLAYWWDNKFNPVEKFLELFESAIKRIINELMPHKDLFLKYKLKADNSIDKASQFEIELSDVVADDVGFKIEGNKLFLEGFRSVDVDSEEEDSTFEETVEKHIETPEIVFKKYMERKEKNN